MPREYFRLSSLNPLSKVEIFIGVMPTDLISWAKYIKQIFRLLALCDYLIFEKNGHCSVSFVIGKYARLRSLRAVLVLLNSIRSHQPKNSDPSANVVRFRVFAAACLLCQF